MNFRALPIAASVIVTLSMPAAAQDTQIDTLYAALGMSDIVEIMHDEGVVYGAEIGADLLGGQNGPAWTQAVEDIYDLPAMQSAVETAFTAALDGQDVTPIVDFFTSEPGRTLVRLEIGARRALLDDALDAASKDAALIAKTDNTERFQLVQDFVAANDLIEINVVGAMNSNVAFYSGLMAGGAFDQSLTQDDILKDVWDQEDDIRTSTEEWVYGFLMLAYDPVSDADIKAYTAFSDSDAGAVLNRALFASFDDMFDAISFALGREAARMMLVQDL